MRPYGIKPSIPFLTPPNIPRRDEIIIDDKFRFKVIEVSYQYLPPKDDDDYFCNIVVFVKKI